MDARTDKHAVRTDQSVGGWAAASQARFPGRSSTPGTPKPNCARNKARDTLPCLSTSHPRVTVVRGSLCENHVNKHAAKKNERLGIDPQKG